MKEKQKNNEGNINPGSINQFPFNFSDKEVIFLFINQILVGKYN